MMNKSMKHPVDDRAEPAVDRKGHNSGQLPCAAPKAEQIFSDKLAYDETFSCIQCGYCLPVCPTYETMGKETHSPRGRINLVKMAAEGKLTDIELLSDSIDRCLGCRACETACPTGVEYGRIYESAKTVIRDAKRNSKQVSRMESWILSKLFPQKKRMNRIGDLLWYYQKSGLPQAARKLRLNRVLPESIRSFEAVMPRVTRPSVRRHRPQRYRPPQGRPKLKAAFFSGCIMDAVFERTNYHSMELLRLAGCEVIPLRQETCCGALHAHAGEHEQAKELAKQNIMAAEKAEAEEHIDVIIDNAGGCGAMLVEYPELFRDDSEWRRRAQAFSAKVKDISEALTSLSPLPYQPPREHERRKVTYQRSCHLSNVQQVTEAPLRLIESIPGVELHEMEDRDKCCGSAGIYNIVNYDDSMDILNVKMDKVSRTDADVLLTTNPGCLLQMKLGIQRAGLEDHMRAEHLVDYLAEVCGISSE